MIFTFLHKPKPKKSNYKPVYYKPDEEDDKKKTISPKEYQEMDLQEKIQRTWSRERKYTSISKNTILRMFIVLLLLLIIIFFVKV